MDPTEAELQAITDLAGANAWAGVDGALLQSLQACLEGVARVREIALIPRGVWDTTVNGLMVPGAREADPARALTPVELARVESLRRVCFLRVGRPTDSPGDPSPAAPAPLGPPLPPAGGGSPGGGGTGSRKLKLSAVLDPTLDAEVQVMTSAEVTACYDSYKARFGDYPTPESDVSIDQLSALRQVISTGAVPFADFSIFGPFGTRRLRRQTFMGYHLNAATGEWSKKELPGPSDFHTWYQDWKCFRTGMLLLEAGQAEHLDAYSEFIRSQVTQFGDEAWWLICRADSRLRSEHLERIRRSLRTTPQYGYTEAAPWSACFAASIKDSDFWLKELGTPATLWLARGTQEVVIHPRDIVVMIPLRVVHHTRRRRRRSTQARTSHRLERTGRTHSTGRESRFASPTTTTNVDRQQHKGNARTSVPISATNASDPTRPSSVLGRERGSTDLRLEG